jgi:hypothetical protein
MSFNPRRILTPGASRKRKERESKKPSADPAAAPTPALKPGEPLSSNRLLAGYMAYEFLTKRTLFGQEFDPDRASAEPPASSSAESKRSKPEAELSVKKEHHSYAEVASVLKTDGAYIPGIVNPTQLARWIQM